MDSREKALNLARLLLDKGALDISVIYIGELSSIADYIVLASGASMRQVRATAQFVIEEYKSEEVRPIGVEGLSNSSWVLVDYGDVILHIFSEELRAYYDLDGLWADAPRIETATEEARLKEVEST